VRILVTFLAAAATCYAASPIVDRVDKTAFIQIEANSFTTLTPQQQALAYWLTQAAIAIDPIIYDQESRFGLQQKHVLEAVIAAKGKVDAPVYSKILDYTKVFWGNKGNHNEGTSQKVMPAFTAAELRHALEQAGRTDLTTLADALRQSFFDPDFEPLITAKSPAGGKDIVQASANNATA